MYQPTGFSDLAGKKVGIFGYGVEGRAAAARLAQHAELVIVDDAANIGPEVLQTQNGGLQALAECDVILKSPGVSPYRADVETLAGLVTITSALNLWMHETDRNRVIGVTGTKGKSTTTALISFFLKAVGQEAVALGNIGLPPYDPSVDAQDAWQVLEISSFQARDLQTAPSILVLTSLGSDHLDWHRTVENYHRDKLSVARLSPKPIIYFANSILDQAFGETATAVGLEAMGLTESLGLLGYHNHSNVALALEATSRATRLPVQDIATKVRASANEFVPLPGRLTEIAREELRGSLTCYVDDGLATTALPTMAALSVFPMNDLVLIAGGLDRGVDYRPLVEAINSRTARTVVVTIGRAGERLGSMINLANANIQTFHARDLLNAVQIARSALTSGGIILFSPAAPSFDSYKNWAERSAAFKKHVLDLLREADESS